jgi:hypothetical protein
MPAWAESLTHLKVPAWETSWRELELAVRRQVTKAMVKTYGKATKAEKSVIMTQLCEVNGWHRDHARRPCGPRWLPHRSAGAAQAAGDGVHHLWPGGDRGAGQGLGRPGRA